MNPLGILLTLFFCFLVWGGTRATAVAGLVGAVCYLTQGQAINLAFNFTAIRIVLLVGIIRVYARGENQSWEYNLVDRYLIAYAICIVAVFTIRNGTFAAFTYQLGFLYNTLLSYFVCRALLPTPEDLKAVLPRLVIILLPFVFFISYEALTGQDVFAIFGGVDTFAWAREGHFRARGSFRSPITAGGFGASLMPLFVAGYFGGLKRGRMIMGMVACFIIVMACHSSGPLMGFLAGMLGLAFWPMRYRMQTGSLGAFGGAHHASPGNEGASLVSDCAHG